MKTHDYYHDLLERSSSVEDDIRIIETIQSDARAEETERANKAEAACAEMRFLIGEATRMLANYSHYWPADRQQFYANVQQCCDSTDCGKGWLSPEKRKELEAELSECREKNLWCVNENLKLQKQVETLVEALENIADAYANNEPISAKWAKEAIASVKGQA